MVNTYISFYLNANRIHIFIEALRGIGSPKRICFMIDKDGRNLLLVPYDKRDFVSHGVPKEVYCGLDSMEVCSKKLCRLIAGLHGWDTAYSYRVPGFAKEEQKLAIFDLTQAEQILRE